MLIFKVATDEGNDPLSKVIMNSPEKKLEFITCTTAHYGLVLSKKKLDQVFKQIESIKNFIDKDKDPDLFLMVEHLDDLINHL